MPVRRFLGSGDNKNFAVEIKNNTFEIAGGKPDSKVSWQVMGVRNDAHARERLITVEEEKPASPRGTYLFPEGYDKERSKPTRSADPKAENKKR